MSSRSIVALEAVHDDVAGALRRALDHAEWQRFISKGADVALKVNLGWNLFVPGAITSPLVVETLIREIRPHVGKVFVVESDQALEDVEPAFVKSGMASVCARTGATFVNMTRSPVDIVECPDNVVLKSIPVPRILRQTELISVPVMKTHAKTRITGALKNQWGCLPKLRHRFHPVLDQAIADLNRVIRPSFCVMDGTIGLEGNGPKSGRPRIANRLLCSGDPVALDTIQTVSMGMDPASIRHLATSAAHGIGTRDLGRIEVRGLDPIRDRVPFLPAEHNAVSRVETWIRSSPFERLVLETPAFELCLAATRVYYELWTRLYAPEYFRRARRHPVYGAQWRPNAL